jgi:hypothetical protein
MAEGKPVPLSQKWTQQTFRGAQEQEENSAVWKRRLIEAFVILTLGDGLIEFLAPKEHSRLWMVAPQEYP